MDLLHRFAPRASRSTRLLLAALVWTGVGTGLLAAGVRWLLAAPRAAWIAAIPLALAAGWAKGKFILAPRAEANARRVEAAGDGRCLGGIFSWSSWAIALFMMAGGAILRGSSIPRPWLGLLYSAIGAALIAASVPSWRRWYRRPRLAPPEKR